MSHDFSAKAKALLLVSVFCCAALNAKPKEKAEEVSVVIMPTTTKNFDASEDYLLDLFRQKLDANFRTYTPFTILSLSNEAQVKALQAKNEGDFGADAVSELASLTGANRAFFSNIVGTKKGYIVTGNFIDLVENAKKATIAPITKEEGEELYDGAGCAADEIITQLCKQVGVKLTASQTVALSARNAEAADEVDEAANIVPQNESDCIKAGYKCFTFGQDAEDNIVFTNKSDMTYEVDIYAVHRKKGFKHFGAITIKPKKGYKDNPLDKDLDQYTGVYMKVTNVKGASIMNMGDKHGDQLFEIQQN